MNGTPEDRRKLWWDLFNLVSLINWRDCGVSPREDKNTGWPLLTAAKADTPSQHARRSRNVERALAHTNCLELRTLRKGMIWKVGAGPPAYCAIIVGKCNDCALPKTTGTLWQPVTPFCGHEPSFVGAVWKFTAPMCTFILRLSQWRNFHFFKISCITRDVEKTRRAKAFISIYDRGFLHALRCWFTHRARFHERPLVNWLLYNSGYRHSKLSLSFSPYTSIATSILLLAGKFPLVSMPGKYGTLPT